MFGNVAVTQCVGYESAVPNRALTAGLEGRSECSPGRQGLLLNGRRRSPLLASPQGGVAASSRISAKPPKPTQPGWFSALRARKTTPSSLSKDASRHFLDRSATPPCGDARRGLRLRQLSNNPSRPGLHSSGPPALFGETNSLGQPTSRV